jgi:hypothetical protein
MTTKKTITTKSSSQKQNDQHRTSLSPLSPSTKAQQRNTALSTTDRILQIHDMFVHGV